jgi:hypothetical protein
MPMFLLSLLSSALAGPSQAPSSLNPAAPAPQPSAPAEATSDPAVLVIDAKVPVEVLLGGTTIAELFYPALVQFQVAATGPQVVRVYVSGQPYDVPVQFAPKETSRILVGRTGVTVETQAADVPAEASGPVSLELRFVGGGGATVRLGSQPHKVGPGRGLSTTIPLGRHALSVRSADGTVIWAAGDLFVEGPLVVQIAEGRLPEISGAGRFVAGGG